MSRRSRLRKRNLKIFLMVLIFLVLIVTVAMATGKIGNQNTINDIQDNNEINQVNIDNDDDEKNKTENKDEIIVIPEKDPDVTINIKATGDIMFHPSQLDGAYDSGTNTYDFTNSFKIIKEVLQDADLTIGNFEGTTAGDETYKYQGYPLFNAPDEVLDAIKDAGFDVLSTVNNHSLDMRKNGIIRTIEQINKRGMDTVGTYVEKPENRVLIKEIKGIKIGIIAYTEMVNGLESVISPVDLDNMVNVINEEKMKKDIQYAKEQNVDILISYLHWGNEYARIQSPRQEQLADMLFTQGVDIIFGSHPHVLQPSKILEYDGKKKFVIYSMGNFISNQREETLIPYGIIDGKYTEDGIVVDVEIEKKGETGEVYIKDIKYIPLWVYKGKAEDGNVEHVVYPIMDYIESDDMDEDSKQRMNRSYKDTMVQIEAYNN